MGVLGGGDDAFMRDSSGQLWGLVEKEIQQLLEQAEQVAKDVITSNAKVHEKLSALLESEEKVEGEKLKFLLSNIQVPLSLRQFVLEGSIQSSSENNSNTVNA
eukprot:TRINITY_DN27058_c0_g1_i2.p1 TRINITY_DN27058_c0_g1~~TRINITY_DN27058_c0_g1_i2.p1  ORF type:complete len:103 (+),score=22.08 TRINITY_DN27058_c0_g1_i2:138-446(+)